MYIMSDRKQGGPAAPGKWSVSQARRRFTELIRSAAHEPQPIYNRQRLVGVVVDGATFEAFMRWREEQAGRTIGTALDELRQICAEEDYQLVVPERVDRESPFGQDER